MAYTMQQINWHKHKHRFEAISPSLGEAVVKISYWLCVTVTTVQNTDHVSECDGELACGLVVLHGARVVKYITARLALHVRRHVAQQRARLILTAPQQPHYANYTSIYIHHNTVITLLTETYQLHIIIRCSMLTQWSIFILNKYAYTTKANLKKLNSIKNCCSCSWHLMMHRFMHRIFRKKSQTLLPILNPGLT